MRNGNEGRNNEKEVHNTESGLQHKPESREKILETYKELIEKNSELMRILMTSFEKQTALLEDLLQASSLPRTDIH